MLHRRGCYLLAGSFAILSLCGVSAIARSTNRLDHAWKLYRNGQQGYCVSYPSRWSKGEALDGTGLFAQTGVKKFAKPSGEIDVMAFPMNQAHDAKPVSLTLADDVKSHWAGLVKFERAERMELLEQRPITLAAKPALFTKDRYYDPLERATWIEEVVFAHHGDLVYRLELQCRADELDRFEPVFTRFINTFQFECSVAR